MKIRKGITYVPSKVGVCLCLLFTAANCQKKGSSDKVVTHLLPAPQKITTNDGISLQLPKIKTVYLYAKAGKEDRFAAKLLQDKIDTLFGRQMNVQIVDSYNNISKPAILLGIPSADQDFHVFVPN